MPAIFLALYIYVIKNEIEYCFMKMQVAICLKCLVPSSLPQSFNLFVHQQKNFELSEEWKVLRRRYFEDKFSDALNSSSLVDFPPTLTDAFSRKKKGSSHDETCDIVLSYNEDDKEYAEFVMKGHQFLGPA